MTLGRSIPGSGGDVGCSRGVMAVEERRVSGEGRKAQSVYGAGGRGREGVRSDRAQSTVLSPFLILTFLFFALPVRSFGMVSGLDAALPAGGGRRRVALADLPYTATRAGTCAVKE